MVAPILKVWVRGVYRIFDPCILLSDAFFSFLQDISRLLNLLSSEAQQNLQSIFYVFINSFFQSLELLDHIFIIFLHNSNYLFLLW